MRRIECSGCKGRMRAVAKAWVVGGWVWIGGGSGEEMGRMGK